MGRVREELLDLLLLRRAKRCRHGHLGLVEVGPVIELAFVLLQRQRHGGKREIAVGIPGSLGAGRRDRCRPGHVVLAGDNAADKCLPVGRDELDLDVEVLCQFGHHIDVVAGIAIGGRIFHRHRIPVAGGPDLEDSAGKDFLEGVLGLSGQGGAGQGDRGDGELNELHGTAPCWVWVRQIVFMC